LRLARNSSRRARSDVSVEGRSVFAGTVFPPDRPGRLMSSATAGRVRGFPRRTRWCSWRWSLGRRANQRGVAGLAAGCWAAGCAASEAAAGRARGSQRPFTMRIFRALHLRTAARTRELDTQRPSTSWRPRPHPWRTGMTELFGCWSGTYGILCAETQRIARAQRRWVWSLLLSSCHRKARAITRRLSATWYRSIERAERQELAARKAPLNVRDRAGVAGSINHQQSVALVA